MFISALIRRLTGLGVAATLVVAAPAHATGTYEDLVGLFRDWQALERPGLRDGAPDYTQPALERRATDLKSLQARLTVLDPAAWPKEQRIDYELVRAQMNGLEFDLRVLQPWTRDPAFYQSVWTEMSDTPEHEGPAHHGLVELWAYSFPLSHADEQTLARGLRVVPPLLAQARGNLTGNARDLWLTGIGTMQGQIESLDDLAARTKSSGAELRRSIADAKKSTVEFVAWLQVQAPSKTGPSGVGKDAYNWNLRHVHLVPMTWDDEVMLLKRELARAHASLRLEEQRNRGLPQLTAASSPEEWDRRANAAVTKYIEFLRSQEILTVQDYLDPAMRERIGP
jgi:hypothetical protein